MPREALRKLKYLILYNGREAGQNCILPPYNEFGTPVNFIIYPEFHM